MSSSSVDDEVTATWIPVSGLMVVIVWTMGVGAIRAQPEALLAIVMALLLATWPLVRLAFDWRRGRITRLEMARRCQQLWWPWAALLITLALLL